MPLTINDITIDTLDPDKVSIPITYTIKDITDPDKVRGSRSTTLKVPMTSNNFNALGNPLGINEDNEVRRARIGDGGTIWQGRADVVERSNDGYKVLLVGDNAEWFADVKTIDIRDIDLGVATFNAANMVDSWLDLDSILYYPIIDYGDLADREIDYDIPLENIRPAIRIKPLLEKIFGDLGYSINWGGTLAPIKWCMPFTGGKIAPSEAFADGNEGDVSGGGTTAWDYVRHPVPLPTIDNDPSGSMSIITNGAFYTPPFPLGKMSVHYQGDILVPSHTQGDQIFLYVVEDFGGANTVLTDTAFTIDIPANAFPQLHSVDFTTQEFDVTGGLKYGLMIITSIVGGQGGNFTFYNGLSNWRVTEILWGDGFEYNIASTLPKLSAMDLIKTVNNLYNAVWETKDGVVTVIPKDEWTQRDTDDWTGKTDLTKAHKWTPSSKDRTVEFKWSEDSSDLNLVNYKESNEIGFGDSDVTLDNKNNSKVKEIKLPFAATWMGKFAGFEVPLLYKNNDREQGQSNYRENEYSFKPRLMIEYKTFGGPFIIGGVSYGFNFPTMTFIRRNSNSITNNLAYGTENGFGEQVGLVDKYYLDQIDIWNTKKTFEGWLNIEPSDIRLLDFSRPKLIEVENGTRTIFLTSIEKYRNGTKGSTKVKGYG